MTYFFQHSIKSQSALLQSQILKSTLSISNEFQNRSQLTITSQSQHWPTSKMTNSLDKYDIVLYHEFPTRSTRVKWLLIELGFDEQVETRYLNLLAGEHKAPSYLAVSDGGCSSLSADRQIDERADGNHGECGDIASF